MSNTVCRTMSCKQHFQQYIILFYNSEGVGITKLTLSFIIGYRSKCHFCNSVNSMKALKAYGIVFSYSYFMLTWHLCGCSLQSTCSRGWRRVVVADDVDIIMTCQIITVVLKTVKTGQKVSFKSFLVFGLCCQRKQLQTSQNADRRRPKMHTKT